MSETKKTRTKDVTSETKVKYAIDLIEELSWVLESKRKLKLSDIPEILRSQLHASGTTVSAANKYVSPNPNIHYLIGVLPRLFQDTNLFSSRDEIADFAKEVLGIDISRVDKRSRYELIGLIVCDCSELDDKKLEIMVEALSSITGNAEKIKMMAKEKQSIGFSWNETIRKLAK